MNYSMAIPDPRLLILETSGKIGRVAVALGDALLAGRTLDETRRHARDLAPAIIELCASQSWKPRELDAVIVSRGPGSYTGLRVGLMTAKTLAYASGCAVLAIETFAAIARQTPAEAISLDVLADAQQRNVYVQRWSRAEGEWRCGELRIRAASEWLAELAPGIWVSGPAVNLHDDAIPAANPRVDPARREPQPSSLLEIGLERWRRGETDDFWSLEPLYLRPSNAELTFDGKPRDGRPWA